jgi:hypothetical protein
MAKKDSRVALFLRYGEALNNYRKLDKKDNEVLLALIDKISRLRAELKSEGLLPPPARILSSPLRESIQEARINKFYTKYYKKKSRHKPSPKLTPEEKQAEVDRRYKDR